MFTRCRGIIDLIHNILNAALMRIVGLIAIRIRPIQTDLTGAEHDPAEGHLGAVQLRVHIVEDALHVGGVVIRVAVADAEDVQFLKLELDVMRLCIALQGSILCISVATDQNGARIGEHVLTATNLDAADSIYRLKGGHIVECTVVDRDCAFNHQIFDTADLFIGPGIICQVRAQVAAAGDRQGLAIAGDRILNGTDIARQADRLGQRHQLPGISISAVALIFLQLFLCLVAQCAVGVHGALDDGCVSFGVRICRIHRPQILERLILLKGKRIGIDQIEISRGVVLALIRALVQIVRPVGRQCRIAVEINVRLKRGEAAVVVECVARQIHAVRIFKIEVCAIAEMDQAVSADIGDTFAQIGLRDLVFEGRTKAVAVPGLIAEIRCSRVGRAIAEIRQRSLHARIRIKTQGPGIRAFVVFGQRPVDAVHIGEAALLVHSVGNTAGDLRHVVEIICAGDLEQLRIISRTAVDLQFFQLSLDVAVQFLVGSHRVLDRYKSIVLGHAVFHNTSRNHAGQRPDLCISVDKGLCLRIDQRDGRTRRIVFSQCGIHRGIDRDITVVCQRISANAGDLAVDHNILDLHTAQRCCILIIVGDRSGTTAGISQRQGLCFLIIAVVDVGCPRELSHSPACGQAVQFQQLRAIGLAAGKRIHVHQLVLEHRIHALILVVCSFDRFLLLIIQ